jgi:hypothetical protein
VEGRKEERKEAGEQAAREDKHEEDEESATIFSPSHIMPASVFIMVLDRDISPFTNLSFIDCWTVRGVH